jgi:formiminotetrahydrofolate cyclodeaminase
VGKKGSRAFRNLPANPSCVETLNAYLERLASRDPVPGGGSAAAVTAALAAALGGMIGRIVSAPVDDLVTRADRLRGELHEARLQDEAAYAGVVAAQALPKRDDAEKAARRLALEEALSGAAEAPLHTAELALEILTLVDRLFETKLGALASDAASAAEFASAALIACGYNVRINHRYMHDEATIREQAKRLVRLEGEASRILGRARAAVAIVPRKPQTP